jgi:hypothetical protein
VRALLLERSVDWVSLRSRRVPLGDDRGSHLTTLEVVLDEVRMSGSRRRPEIRAREGRFVATFDAGAVEALVAPPPVVDAIAIHDDGLRVSTVAGIAFMCDVVLRERTILLTPRAPDPLRGLLPWPSLARPVPELPLGAMLREVRVEAGQVVCSGSLATEELRFSTGRPQ